MARELEFDQVTTRGGDAGDSSLYDGRRRAKDDPLFEALGDLDELTSWLGVVRAHGNGTWDGPLRDLDADIRAAQLLISRIAALVACAPGSSQFERLEPVDESAVEELELTEARLLRVTRIRPSFVVPGETALSAEIDVCRAMCRRCERRLVSVIRSPGAERPDLHPAQRYLNRLSDFLFVVARCYEQQG